MTSEALEDLRKSIHSLLVSDKGRWFSARDVSPADPFSVQLI